MNRTVFPTSPQQPNDQLARLRQEANPANDVGCAPRSVNSDASAADVQKGRVTCLTEVSNGSLIAGAIAVSVLLWLAILAVI